MAIFMKWGDVKGGATESKHKDWIPLNSANTNFKKPSTINTGGGTSQRTTNTVAFEHVNVSMGRDASTPLLFKACMNGSPADAVTIDFVRESGDTTRQIKLKDGIITNMSGMGGDNQSLYLTYAQICVIQYNQDATGKITGQTKWGWDVLTDTESIW